MAKNNCYAIRKGYDSKKGEVVINRIVDTWEECYSLVKGVKGAIYKGFTNMDEAKEYINQENCDIKTIEDVPTDCMCIFVDGSYNESTRLYSYGFVVLKNEIVEYIESSKGQDTSKKEIRQVAGELEAAMKSVEYALSKNERRVAICLDYIGAAHHATGAWERKDESSKLYYEKMQEYMKKGIEIIFVKVPAHTGVIWNEMADEKCKEELNIKSDGVVRKWLKDNKIIVQSQEIKNQILSIAPGRESKIEVIGSGKTCSKEDNTDVGTIAKQNAEKSKKVEKLFSESQMQALIYIQSLSETEKVDCILHLLSK